MTRPRDLDEENSDESKSRWRQAPNRRRPEAVAMRRIIVEQGRWLSPFMRGAPLPVLTEWEKTVDLSRLASVNYLPVDPADEKPTPKPQRLGRIERSIQSRPNLSDLRETQAEMNRKRTEKRRRKSA